MKQLMLNIDKDSDLWIGIFSATSQKIQTYVVCVPDDIFHRGGVMSPLQLYMQFILSNPL